MKNKRINLRLCFLFRKRK